MFLTEANVAGANTVEHTSKGNRLSYFYGCSFLKIFVCFLNPFPPCPIDQGYSSIQLCKWLAGQGYYFVTSVQSMRPAWLFNDGLHHPKLQPQELHCAFSPDGTMAAASWRDRNTFNCLTNMVDPRDTVDVLHKDVHKRGSKSYIKLPKFAQMYRMNYHKVDLINQQVQKVLLNSRCRKWNLHIFHSVIVWSAYNGWRLYTDSQNKKTSFPEYVCELAQAMACYASNDSEYCSRFN